MKRNNRDLLFFALSLALWWGLWYMGLVPKTYVVGLAVLLIAYFSTEWIRESAPVLKGIALFMIALLYPYAAVAVTEISATGPLEGLITLLFALHFLLQWIAFRDSFSALFQQGAPRLFAALFLSIAFGLVWATTDLALPDGALIRALPARIHAAYPRALIVAGIHLACFLFLPDVAVKKHGIFGK